jgi:hypothetical protein
MKIKKETKKIKNLLHGLGKLALHTGQDGVAELGGFVI